MSSYLTLAELKQLSVMPSQALAELETVEPGWIANNIELVSGDIDAQLRKRYAAPFAAPYPDKVRRWVVDLITPIAYLRWGVNAQDMQFPKIEARETAAKAEIAQAADAVNGLWDLPLRQDTTESGVTEPATLAYSEASPYVGFTIDRERGQDEDDFGEGTEF